MGSTFNFYFGSSPVPDTTTCREAQAMPAPGSTSKLEQFSVAKHPLIVAVSIVFVTIAL